MADWDKILQQAAQIEADERYEQSVARYKTETPEDAAARHSNLDCGHGDSTPANEKQHQKNLAKHKGIYDAAVEMKVADLKKGWFESPEDFKARQAQVRNIERNKQADAQDFSRQETDKSQQLREDEAEERKMNRRGYYKDEFGHYGRGE
jgi:hypothetical protein